MGFLSLFSNLGSIGSTTRWAIKEYSAIKSQNKRLSDEKIFKEIIKNRYLSMSDDEKESYLLNQIHTFPGLAGLICEILNVEAGLYKNVYTLSDMVKPVINGLEKTDFSSKQKYGNLTGSYSKNFSKALTIHSLVYWILDHGNRSNYAFE